MVFISVFSAQQVNSLSLFFFVIHTHTQTHTWVPMSTGVADGALTPACGKDRLRLSNTIFTYQLNLVKWKNGSSTHLVLTSALDRVDNPGSVTFS